MYNFSAIVLPNGNSSEQLQINIESYWHCRRFVAQSSHSSTCAICFDYVSFSFVVFLLLLSHRRQVPQWVRFGTSATHINPIWLAFECVCMCVCMSDDDVFGLDIAMNWAQKQPGLKWKIIFLHIKASACHCGLWLDVHVCVCVLCMDLGDGERWVIRSNEMVYASCRCSNSPMRWTVAASRDLRAFIHLSCNHFDGVNSIKWTHETACSMIMTTTK